MRSCRYKASIQERPWKFYPWKQGGPMRDLAHLLASGLAPIYGQLLLSILVLKSDSDPLGKQKEENFY